MLPVYIRSGARLPRPPEQEGEVLPVQAQRVLLRSRGHRCPARARRQRVASWRRLGQRVVGIARQHDLHSRERTLVKPPCRHNSCAHALIARTSRLRAPCKQAGHARPR